MKVLMHPADAQDLDGLYPLLAGSKQQLPRLELSWADEHTFAWLGQSRRLAWDYEGQTGTEAVWVYLAMTHLILRWLAFPFPDNL